MAQQSKITRLENAYTKQIQAQQQQNKSILTKQRKKRAALIMGVFLVACLVLSTEIVHAKLSLGQTQTEIVGRQQKLKTTKATNQNLQEHVKLLNNKAYLENLIRSKYYYSKSGETIYSLPSDKASDVTAK